MTALDQFDPFAGRVTSALEEIAPTTRPAYLDTVLAQTAATRQRPRWTFLGRWLPMDTAIPRSPGLARVPVRLLVLLVLLIVATIAVAALLVGAQRRVPSPFGPADNGAIAYTSGGDLYVRDTLDATGRLLIGGEGDQVAPSFSPDGQWLSFVTDLEDGAHFMVAKADGSGVREVALMPKEGNAQGAWRPDSKAIALIYDLDFYPQLTIAFLDGSPTLNIKMPYLFPLELAWRPPDGSDLLVRAQTYDGAVGLYLVRPDGSDQRPIVTPVPASVDWGTWYTNAGPVWSPDGRTIAYGATVRVPELDHDVFRVHRIDADGSNDRELPGPPLTLHGRPLHENWPLFSPDGRWILVHRWQLNDFPDAKGWLAVMPSDGSAPARDIGPKIPGGHETGLIKAWSPDGSRVLMRAENTTTAYSIDPITGEEEVLDWTTDLPDWQRVARR
jgi:hypothetical protein